MTTKPSVTGALTGMARFDSARLEQLAGRLRREAGLDGAVAVRANRLERRLMTEDGRGDRDQEVIPRTQNS
jgi:hypothetical protein